ncbi:recombinase family protein [Streptomyces parvus]|uniref:Recombinase family protein n=1 Tax=Streptomyces parvus TaxID=66428 RepID=A0A7K3RT98_9ACTN|nr:recombinase family protein [Streptomyces parvus]NEC18435.1 recombinase family protein [Streptomyces parvus]
MDNVETPATTPYDGCGRCLVAVRRLSRKNEASQSPEKQRDQVLAIVEANDAHVIAWADDWEVSGAMDPLKRPQLGPWLTDKKGPYDGIAGAAVDRIGRNVRDVLNTAYTIHERGQILLTADHDGIWDLDDSNQETDLLVKALGAQMEHRATRRRSNDSKTSARNRGRVSAKPSYGYEYFRAIPNGPVSEIRLRSKPAREIRNVARRILADQTGTITPNFEFKRLNRNGVLSPSDELAVIYGREPKGIPWSENSLRRILLSKAALGYLIHDGEPVLDENGRPVKIAPELWDYATHLALVEKLAPKKQNSLLPVGRANQGKALYAGRCFCGVCKNKMRANSQAGYQCTARHRGIAPKCKPSPSVKIEILDEEVTEQFLAEYGQGQVMEKVYDPGTNYAAQIAELQDARARLRKDRQGGMYEDEDDYHWYVTEYNRMGDEIKKLKKLPERPAGVRLIPTGQTIAEQWKAAESIPDKQEILSEFGVRIEIFPRGVKRIVMTAVDPYAELAALEAT